MSEVQPFGLSEDLLTRQAETDRARSSRRAALAVLAGVAFASVAGHATVSAQTPPSPGRIEFILDASGSMRGRLGATEKIAVARALVSALREDLADAGMDPPVGLRVYGADSDRSERNCLDTRRLIAPSDTLASWGRVLSSVTPRGVSPLAEALERAAADTANTYVLITDGADNCDRDACAVWRAAWRVAGARARLHIIALDPTPGDLEPLRCLSRTGSGALLQLRAVDQVETIAERLTLILRNEGKLSVRTSVGIDSSFVVPVEVRQPLTRELVARLNSNDAVPIPAGMYTIVAGTTPRVSIERVLVLPGETTTIERADFGRLRVDLLDPGNQPVRAAMSVFRAGELEEIRFARTGDPIVVPAGVYDVRVDVGDAFELRYGVRVDPGETRRVVLGGTGSLRIIAPGIDAPETHVRITGPGIVDTVPVGGSVRVPAGRYRLTVFSIPPYVADNQRVEPRGETLVEIAGAGVIGVDLFGLTGVEPGVEIDVVSPATGELLGKLRSGERRIAMPGEYRLVVRTVPDLVVDAAVVRARATTVIERRGLSRIELASPLLSGGIDYRLEVMGLAGETLVTVSGTRPVVPVWPGRYRARLWRADALVFDGPIAVARDRAAIIDSNLPARGDDHQ